MNNAARITAAYLFKRIVEKQVHKLLLVSALPIDLKYTRLDVLPPGPPTPPQKKHMHHQHKGDIKNQSLQQ